MKQGKENWVQSDFKFDEIQIGMKVFHVEVGTESEVCAKTSNSIETKNFANKNFKYLTGQEDDSGEILEGRLRGINARNWYTLDGFNRTFQRVL